MKCFSVPVMNSTVILQLTRSYRATFRNDSEFQIKISRPQEIPVYVGMDSFYDLGITGQDWVEETDSDVEEILPLEYGHIDIILAVREEREDINTFEDLMNLADGDILISTEYLNIAEKYILEKTENKVAPAILTPWKRLNTPRILPVTHQTHAVFWGNRRETTRGSRCDH